MELVANWLGKSWAVMLALSPWLLFGLAMAGLLHVLFPVDYVRRHLGGRGFVNVLKATLVGIPMPLCSCGVIPAGIGLKKDGASDGATIGFLISTPQTGVDSLFVSASMLGWPFALFKIGAALVTGMVGGVLTNHVGHAHHAVGAPAGQRAVRGGPVVRARELVRFSFVELLGPIAGWIAVGVLVAGLISALPTENFFAGKAWMTGLPAMLIMLVIALPMYVCAVASVPIAASLVVAGMPTGAALVFLMAGPASNVATVGAILKAFGRRVAAIYVGTVAVGSVLLGWFFDGVIGGAGAGAAGPHIHGEPHWWAIACAVAATIMIAAHIVRRLPGGAAPPTKPQAGGLLLDVGGMTCPNCAAHVREAIASVPGVASVAVDLEGGRARVAGEGIDPDALVRAIEESGYTAAVHKEPTT